MCNHRGRVVLGPFVGDELSGDELSVGQSVSGTNCQWDELSVGRIVSGRFDVVPKKTLRT